METTQEAEDRARWKSPAAASSTFRRKEDWVRERVYLILDCHLSSLFFSKLNRIRLSKLTDYKCQMLK